MSSESLPCTYPPPPPPPLLRWGVGLWFLSIALFSPDERLWVSSRWAVFPGILLKENNCLPPLESSCHEWKVTWQRLKSHCTLLTFRVFYKNSNKNGLYWDSLTMWLTMWRTRLYPEDIHCSSLGLIGEIGESGVKIVTGFPWWLCGFQRLIQAKPWASLEHMVNLP